MNALKLNLKLIIAIFITSLFTSCEAYKDVTFLGMQDYRMGTIDGDMATIFLTVKVDNPNSYNIKIKKSTFDLYFDGGKVGIAELAEDIKLLKKKEGNYEMKFNINYKKIMNSSLSMLGSLLTKNDIKIGVKGKAKAKALLISKKFDVDFEEKISTKEFMKLTR